MENIKNIKFGKTDDNCLVICIPASTSVREVGKWIKDFLKLAKPQVGEDINIDYTMDENGIILSIFVELEAEKVDLINYESTVWDEIYSLESDVYVLQCCYMNEAEEYQAMINSILECLARLNDK